MIYEYKKSYTPPDSETDLYQGGRDGSATESHAASAEDVYHTVSVYDGHNTYVLTVQHGRTLRSALLEHNLSPHGWLTKHVNCDGSGQCSACAVQVDEGGDHPDQWLDSFLASRDMGRLSCQIDVTDDMSVRV